MMTLRVSIVLAAVAIPLFGQAPVKVWNNDEALSFRLPLAGLGAPPKLISEEQYYALPEYNLKTYPVYHPNKEPAGYLDWLKQQDPKPLVDLTRLKSDADWIA